MVAIGLLPGSPELDCGGVPDPNNPQGWIGGLSYCTRGGTGAMVLSVPTYPTFEPFPACCEPDGNGYGTLSNNSGFPPPGFFSLKPNATSSQIRTGDVLIQRVTTNGVTTETPTMLPFVFATTLGLVAYDDGQGNAATVNYPVDPRTGPGIFGNGFPVAAGPNGDVTLKLTFWRPQRRSIPPLRGRVDWQLRGLYRGQPALDRRRRAPPSRLLRPHRQFVSGGRNQPVRAGV